MQNHFKKIRVIVALIFIIAFIVAFADIKGSLPSWYYKSFLFLQFIPSLLKFFTPTNTVAIGFIIVLIITLIGGRVYCSTICPLGTLQDIIIFLRKKISPKNRFRFKKALTVLRYSIFGITIGSLFINGLLAMNLLDPYANFGRMGTHLLQPVILWINNLLAKLLPALGLNILESRPLHLVSFLFSTGMLTLVFLMSVLRGRLYCNTVCPIGTIFGLLSKISFYKIKIKPSTCTKCGKCQAVCKANCINIKTLEIDNSRCVACYNCIPACNDSSIGYTIKKKNGVAKSEPESAGRRRLFLLSAVGYLAAKALPLKAAESESNENPHVCYYDRGTVTPPGATGVEHLHERCISCHLCISACPTKVLQPTFLEYGFSGMMMPKMDYAVYFCNYDCTVCSEVCPTGAIIQLSKEEKKITQIGKVQFQQEYCIVETEGNSCGSCSEHCPTQAVTMIPYKDDLTIPQTDVSICIGCGGCEYACPVENPHPAIFVIANKVHQKVDTPQTEKIEYQEKEDFPF
jgi:ferredoxin